MCLLSHNVTTGDSQKSEHILHVNSSMLSERTFRNGNPPPTIFFCVCCAFCFYFVPARAAHLTKRTRNFFSSRVWPSDHKLRCTSRREKKAKMAKLAVESYEKCHRTTCEREKEKTTTRSPRKKKETARARKQEKMRGTKNTRASRAFLRAENYATNPSRRTFALSRVRVII